MSHCTAAGLILSGLRPCVQPGHSAGKGPPRRAQGEPGEAAEKAEHTWEWRAVCFGWGVRFSEGQIRGQGMADLEFLVSKGGRLNSEAGEDRPDGCLGAAVLMTVMAEAHGLLKGQRKGRLKSHLSSLRALGLLHPELPSTPHSPSLGTCDISFLPDLRLSHPSDLNLNIASSGELPVICS